MAQSQRSRDPQSQSGRASRTLIQDPGRKQASSTVPPPIHDRGPRRRKLSDQAHHLHRLRLGDRDDPRVQAQRWKSREVRGICLLRRRKNAPEHGRPGPGGVYLVLTLRGGRRGRRGGMPGVLAHSTVRVKFPRLDLSPNAPQISGPRLLHPSQSITTRQMRRCSMQRCNS